MQNHLGMKKGAGSKNLDNLIENLHPWHKYCASTQSINGRQRTNMVRSYHPLHILMQDEKPITTTVQSGQNQLKIFDTESGRTKPNKLFSKKLAGQKPNIILFSRFNELHKAANPLHIARY